MNNEINNTYTETVTKETDSEKIQHSDFTGEETTENNKTNTINEAVSTDNEANEDVVPKSENTSCKSEIITATTPDISLLNGNDTESPPKDDNSNAKVDPYTILKSLFGAEPMETIHYTPNPPNLPTEKPVIPAPFDVKKILSNANADLKKFLNPSTVEYIMQGMQVTENYEPYIPESLRDTKSWICQEVKQPRSPNGRYPISPKDKKQCTTYNKAVAAVQKYGYDGVSLMLTKEDPYTVIDIDHCIEDKNIHPLALAIIKKINSYAEVSFSGTGVHIILESEIHQDWRKKCANALDEGVHLEIYSFDRHMTFTGHVIENYKEVRYAEKELTEVYNTFMKPKVQTYTQPNKVSPPPQPMSNEEILELLKIHKNGNKFIAALNGDFSYYEKNDRSSIDSSVAAKLAFYTTNGDQIEDIMRKSRMFRDKWDSPRGNISYLRYVIEEALKTVTEHYHSSKTMVKKTATYPSE